MPTPTTETQIDNLIDQEITSKTARKSITPMILGTLLKTLRAFISSFFIAKSEKGQADGVATLGTDGKVLTSQLPVIVGGGDASTQIYQNDGNLTTEHIGRFVALVDETTNTVKLTAITGSTAEVPQMVRENIVGIIKDVQGDDVLVSSVYNVNEVQFHPDSIAFIESALDAFNGYTLALFADEESPQRILSYIVPFDDGYAAHYAYFIFGLWQSLEIPDNDMRKCQHQLLKNGLFIGIENTTSTLENPNYKVKVIKYGNEESAMLDTTTNSSGIPEAPTDGNLYGRKNSNWESITTDGTLPSIQEGHLAVGNSSNAISDAGEKIYIGWKDGKYGLFVSNNDEANPKEVYIPMSDNDNYDPTMLRNNNNGGVNIASKDNTLVVSPFSVGISGIETQTVIDTDITYSGAGLKSDASFSGYDGQRDTTTYIITITDVQQVITTNDSISDIIISEAFTTNNGASGEVGYSQTQYGKVTLINITGTINIGDIVTTSESEVSFEVATTNNILTYTLSNADVTCSNIPVNVGSPFSNGHPEWDVLRISTDFIIPNLIVGDQWNVTVRAINSGGGLGIDFANAIYRIGTPETHLAADNRTNKALIVQCSDEQSKGLIGINDYTQKAKTDPNAYVQYAGLNEMIAQVRPYKVYTALLTQTDTNAPVATILENTLSEDVTWTRDDVGIYIASVPSLFPVDKTFLICTQQTNQTNPNYPGTGGCYRADFSPYSDGRLLLQIVMDDASGTSEFGDNTLYNHSVEIRVYN